MPLVHGTRLGPYEVQSPLGAGGMGEVYRARDTRLDRAVAIKVLPADMMADADRRSRFEREARAIAALTHPHICTLYDVGHENGVEFLVMELVEGETLDARLQRGRIELGEALRHATHIAGALDAAHRQGIVHRDLKPANVMLTRTGVKLLDFGLAKLRADRPEAVEGLTDTALVTARGQILGTLQYMAPEQLEGRDVDARADLFAFGAVVYEMLTGRRAFDGNSPASVIGAILHTSPPPVGQLVPGVPRALDRLLAHCLARNPSDRWASTHDLLLRLGEIAEAPDAGPPEAAKGMRGREMTAWVTAAVTTAAAAVAGAMLFSSRPGPPAADAEIAVLSIVPPAGAELVSGEAPQISPDGRRLAFVATDRTGRAGLYVRELDAVEATRLADTEDVTLPFWAPDSRRVGFFARGQLRTVSIAGGQVRVLAPAPVPRGGTWNREDVILFIPLPSRPPHRVSAAGGPAVPVPVVATERTRWFPSFLPDGRHYLYVSASVGSSDRALKVGALDSSDTQVLVPSQANAVYLASGHVLYRADGALVAHPFDHEARRLTGEPVVVVGDLGFNAITYQALYSASDAGTIAWQASRPTSELVWFDRAGKRLDVAVGAGHYTAFCLAAGDRRIVFEAADAISGNVDLWITDALGGTPSRLTFDTAVDFYPVCSPTSDAVVFSSLRDGAPNLYRLDLARPGTEGRLLASPVPKIATDWSRDGRALLFWLLAPTTGSDIWTVGSDGAGARAIVASDAQERDGRLSPDGRWIAYHSNETGEAEVYVRPFPAGPGTWQVSTGGGMQPQWQRDGRQLYYLTPDNRLVSVAVQSGSSGISFAAPTVLMPLRLAGWEPGRGQYAVTADGTRVLVSSKTDEALSITLKTRWAPAAPR